MPIVKIDGLNTHYEISGEGDTVILLHNGFSCGKMWKKITPILVAGGFRVLVYDRRGYGQSDGGVDFEAHYVSPGFRDAAVEALAELVDHLDIETCHIIGQCEGGVVGVDYAARYSHKVMTLTTASTLCFSEMIMEDFNRLKFPPTYNDLPTDIQKKYIDWHGSDRAESFFALCSRYGGSYGMGMFDLRPELGNVSCPCLVMYPDRGHFFEVEQGVAFFRSLADGELAIFPKCGHNIFEHYPELYARTAIRFMEHFTKLCILTSAS